MPYRTVTGALIADGTVGTADLADGAVTEAKIANGAVTGNKVAYGIDLSAGDLSVDGFFYAAAATAFLLPNTPDATSEIGCGGNLVYCTADGCLYYYDDVAGQWRQVYAT